MISKALKAIFDNFRLKLWALVISMGIWVYASSQITEEATFRAALHIIPPPGYAVVYQSDASARVTVAGPRFLLARLRSDLSENHLTLTHDLADSEAVGGWATLKIVADWLMPRLPEREYVQLRLREAIPAELKVLTDRIKQRALPVVVRASVQTAPGFRLAEGPSCSPSHVQVRGPAAAVDALEAVSTRELTLYDIQADVQQEVSLQTDVEVALDNGERASVPVEVDPPKVTARIRVSGEEEQEQVFEQVPVWLLAPPQFPYVAELPPGAAEVSVVVRASPTNLRRLRRESIRAYVDLAKLAAEPIEPGSSHPYTEKLRVSLPPDVTAGMARAQPDEVTLRLKNPAQ
jgi:hypothetical protein